MTLKPALRVILFLALLACLQPSVSCQTTTAGASQQPLSLREYVAELDRCSSVLNAPAGDSTALRNLRVSLPANWTVAAGESRYSVATDWLTDGLARIETNPRAARALLPPIRQRLQAYREAAQAVEAPDRLRSLERSRARLNSILSAKEFQGQQGPTWLDVVQARILSWIGRHLDKLFGRIARVPGIGNVIAWTVIILAALFLTLWVVRFLMRAGSRSEMDLRGASALGQDWHYWLRAARTAAERGDYRAAIRAAYWAGVARLEATTALPEDRSRTPRESLRLIGRDSAAYAPLSQLTRRFELVWYGYRSATDADWSDAMRQLETLGCLGSSTPAIAGS